MKGNGTQGTGFALIIVIPALLLLRSSTGAQEAHSDPRSYHVVHGWPRVPVGELLGQVSGVGVDSHGIVYTFRRAQHSWGGEVSPSDVIREPTVLMFDGASGRLIGSWGAGSFAMPHGLTIDTHDNVWVTDVALHQVLKFTRNGRLLLALGERGIPGDDIHHFNRPTDVAVAADGSFYVSDGYGNARVIHFAKDGQFLATWGRFGEGPGEFRVPHSLALDTYQNVYVADRGNSRIEIFDSSGHFLAQWRSPELGRPWAVRFGADGFIYIVDGGDQIETGPQRARVLRASTNGRIVDSLGAFGNYDGEFVWPHAIAVAPDGTVYVGDVSTGMRVQKFIHEP